MLTLSSVLPMFQMTSSKVVVEVLKRSMEGLGLSVPSSATGSSGEVMVRLPDIHSSLLNGEMTTWSSSLAFASLLVLLAQTVRGYEDRAASSRTSGTYTITSTFALSPGTSGNVVGCR